MARATALGVDLGTSLAKAVVLDTDEIVLAQAACDYPVVRDDVEGAPR